MELAACIERVRTLAALSIFTSQLDMLNATHRALLFAEI